MFLRRKKKVEKKNRFWIFWDFVKKKKCLFFSFFHLFFLFFLLSEVLQNIFGNFEKHHWGDAVRITRGTRSTLNSFRRSSEPAKSRTPPLRERYADFCPCTPPWNGNDQTQGWGLQIIIFQYFDRFWNDFCSKISQKSSKHHQKQRTPYYTGHKVNAMSIKSKLCEKSGEQRKKSIFPRENWILQGKIEFCKEKI